MENRIPEEWIEMISNQEASGKSEAAWCRENGISSSTFYYRRKKVKEAEEDTESVSTPNEVVRINFKDEEAALNPPTADSERIRMIKGDVMFEFPVSVTEEILSAVMRGGGTLC